MHSHASKILSALFLAALVVAIVWGFAAFGNQASLLTGAAPPTSVSPLATPTPRVMVNPFGNTEPIFGEYVEPPPTPKAAPTPVAPPIDWSKPTGGPYISEEKAIGTAMSIAENSGEVNRAIAPRAVFTTAAGVDRITEYPRPRLVDNQREVWVVEIAGSFNHSRPEGLPVVLAKKLFVTMDASSGSLSMLTYREY